MVETGCQCRAVSAWRQGAGRWHWCCGWLRAWWRHGAGAGRRAPVLAPVRWLRAWWRQGAGARWRQGAVSWLRVETGRRSGTLAAHVVETGCRALGAGPGRRELARRRSVLASEVITTAASDSEGWQTAASDNEAPAVMGRVNLCTQHHTVLSLERPLSISAVGYLHWFCFGRQLCQGLYLRAYFSTYNVAQRQARNRPWFQHATHTIVVLDTAWPWASEAYGLCRLRAYLCAHELIRARSYGHIVLQIVASVNSGAAYCLALGQ